MGTNYMLKHERYKGKLTPDMSIKPKPINPNGEQKNRSKPRNGGL